MPAVIYKYPLEVADSQTFGMPEGAKILSAQVQNGTICLWALLDPLARQTERTFDVFGTGHKVDDAERVFIDTVQMLGGSLIVHVFERVRP